MNLSATTINNGQGLNPDWERTELNSPQRSTVVNQSQQNLDKEYLREANSELVNQSLASCEGLREEDASATAANETKPEAAKPPANSFLSMFLDTKHPYYEMLRDTFPQYATVVASIVHFVSAINGFKSFLPQVIGDFIDKQALKLSKSINIYNYCITAVDAFLNKRSVDALARMAFPVVIPMVDVNDFFMASGFSSGGTMIEKSLQEKTKTMPHNNELLGNISNNVEGFMEMWKDLLKDGLGAFGSKLWAVWKGDYKSLMFVGANCNVLGALLGTTIGQFSGLMRKVATIVRIKGSIETDIAKIFSGDTNFTKAGIAYIVVAALDLIKDYAGQKARPTAHLSLATNNFANYFYLNASKERSKVTTSQAA